MGAAATGTSVNLAVTLGSNASASFQNDCCDQSSATVSTQFQLLDVKSGNDPQANFLVNDGAGSFSNVENLGVEVGDTLYLYGSIFASGNANSGNAGGLRSLAISDAATLNLDSSVTGLILQSASGHDYGSASPVPLPAAGQIASVAGCEYSRLGDAESASQKCTFKAPERGRR